MNDTILYVLETNPDIKASEANKQAIEFELDQAQTFWAPRFELEGRVGLSFNDGTTTSSLPAADEAIAGYELRARVTQRLWDGFETRSEIERQAYRVDAAALRVLERAEFLSLEAVRVYAEVLRTRRLVALARENVEYHRRVREQIDQAFSTGLLGLGDQQQAEERIFLAEDTLVSFQLDADEAEIRFLETVGIDPTGLGTVPNLAGRMPADEEAALSIARRNNPTIRFLQADVGSADALSRKVAANQYPTLNLEAETRYGDDLDGFEGRVSEGSVGLVLRYEFQGSQKRALRQEHIRRASESRARLLAQTRLVEREVRETWANRSTAQRRVSLVTRQAQLSRDLRTSYEREFEVGNRSLLDILNTQVALFQAEASLVNLRSLETFINYRLLAATGTLLPTLGVAPPEDALSYAREFKGAPDIGATPSGRSVDAKSFTNWRKSLDDR